MISAKEMNEKAEKNIEIANGITKETAYKMSKVIYDKILTSVDEDPSRKEISFRQCDDGMSELKYPVLVFIETIFKKLGYSFETVASRSPLSPNLSNLGGYNGTVTIGWGD